MSEKTGAGTFHTSSLFSLIPPFHSDRSAPEGPTPAAHLISAVINIVSTTRLRDSVRNLLETDY